MCENDKTGNETAANEKNVYDTNATTMGTGSQPFKSHSNVLYSISSNANDQVARILSETDKMAL